MRASWNPDFSLTTMRVLYVCNEYPPAIHGGIGTFVRSLGETLAAAGHEVAVVGFASHVRETMQGTENGVRVVRLAWPRGRNVVRLGGWRFDSTALAARMTLSKEVARFAAGFVPDVVESHDWSGPLWTRPARPFLMRLHGASSVHAWSGGKRASRVLRFFERRNLLMADAIVAPSRFIARTTGEALRLRGKAFQILHHGVDTERFGPGLSPRSSNEVLFAGTVKRQKGIQDLFGAMPRILAAYPLARFTIAGRYPSDPADACSPRALLAGLAPSGGSWKTDCADPAARVAFLGQVPQTDLAALYARAAVAVFPSHNEAFGLACAEAMACGAAVVMTVRGSGPELVEHGVSGLLVEPEDSGAIAAAVLRLLGDAGLRRRLGTAARARILEQFNLRDMAARNAAFYARLASRFRWQHTIHA